ncbi:MAG: MinD/ParA family protein [Kyrpidia sp.]|nr:MinD/ParA family protein [Kyrpidia sp.]
MDQASDLRRRVAERTRTGGHIDMRTLAVTSGKGGVGKSNLAVNIALAIQEEGANALVLDADVGFANVDVLLGRRSERTIVDLVQPGVRPEDVVQRGPLGMRWISGGTALTHWVHMSKEQAGACFDKLRDLESDVDWVIVDTGAGLNEASLHILGVVDDILLVTTPEPTALADAYALIKVVVRRLPGVCIRLVVNRCRSFAEGLETSNRLTSVCQAFLSYEPAVAGYILEDPALGQAVQRQIPVLVGTPNSRASQCIRQIARRVMGRSDAQPERPLGSARSGWREFVWKLQHAFGRG